MIKQKENINKYKNNFLCFIRCLFFSELISLVSLFLIVFHLHSVAFLLLLFLTAFVFLNITDLVGILWLSSFILKKPVVPFFLITHFVVNCR